MLPRCAIAAAVSLVCMAAYSTPLVRVSDAWQYRPGLEEPSRPGQDWRTDFADSAVWLEGRSGFSLGLGYAGEATALPSTATPYSTAYFRRAFILPERDAVKWLTLRIDYADGFVAYLNGREIARQSVEGAPGSFVAYNRLALAPRGRGAAIELDVTGATNVLTAGVNVLAIQTLSVTPSGFGLSVSAELLANAVRGPFVQNMSSNRVQVIWKTPVPSDTRLRYGAAGQAMEMWMEPAPVTTHVVTLTNLLPGTLYEYQASSGAGDVVASEPASEFRAFRPDGPVSFVVFGDGGWNSLPQYQIAEVMRQANPDFVIETGDTVYPSFTSELVDLRCFSVYQGQMTRTPFFFTLGNHDLISGVANYLEAFYLPTNSIPLAEHAPINTSPEHYYSFDAGDAHFVVLFVPFLSQYRMQVGDPQYRWLTNDLAQTRKPWKIAFWHHPMNSSSAHRRDDYDFSGTPDRLDVRNVLLPVLSEHGVQLVVCGHEHGYERFNPMSGVHSITTAGGGAFLYGFTELDEASAFYVERHHCVKVSIDGATLRAEALDTTGAVFDRLTIQSQPPAPSVHSAAWHTPDMAQGPANDGLGNIAGQRFDFAGAPIQAASGQFSNLGELYVNNDGAYLYLGLAGAGFYNANNVFLFVESPRLIGVTNMAGLGNGLIDPNQQGADGLDMLENLSFQAFEPAVACVLGDEYADGQFRAFVRTNLSLNIGQGVFRLDAQLSDVFEARVQQFHLSPQAPGARYWPSAAYMQVAIPFEQLGGIGPGDAIKLGALIAGPSFNETSQWREFDSGFIGASSSGSGLRPVILEGAEVRLATDPAPDEDHDGLTLSQELALGTDPRQADSDGDKLPDGWEYERGLNPLSAIDSDGASGDPDGDGANNEHELFAGTDPRDAASVLKLQLTRQAENKLQFSFHAAPDRQYFLQANDGAGNGFVDVPGVEIPISIVPKDVVLELDVTSGQRPVILYRVRVGPVLRL